MMASICKRKKKDFEKNCINSDDAEPGVYASTWAEFLFCI